MPVVIVDTDLEIAVPASGRADIPHLAMPFRFTGSKAAVTDQDSPEEIAQCVETILRYPTDFRVERPEFGTPDQTFRTQVDLDEIAARVEEWEPRADAELREEVSLDPLIRQIVVEVRGGQLG